MFVVVVVVVVDVVVSLKDDRFVWCGMVG